MKILCIGGPLDGEEIDSIQPWSSPRATKMYFRFTNRYENDGVTPIYEWSETIDDQ